MHVVTQIMFEWKAAKFPPIITQMKESDCKEIVDRIMNTFKLFPWDLFKDNKEVNTIWVEALARKRALAYFSKGKKKTALSYIDRVFGPHSDQLHLWFLKVMELTSFDE